MKSLRIVLVFLFVFTFLLPKNIFADSRSDFDYQYSKYREHFFEFSLFKKDYISAPTLDNQQKALLSTKQTLSARDLTKASFAAYVRDLILLSGINYPVISPVLQKLVAAQQYFSGESAKGHSLVTLSDLEEFDTNYTEKYSDHEKSIKLGIVAHKITTLKAFTLKQESALKTLKEKMPTNVSVRVTERITTLEQNLAAINQKVDGLATYLVSEEGMENTESEIFFSSKVDQLAEIRALQLDWLDQLIDIDLNYGKI